MENYEEFYKKKLIMLDTDYYFLSAGLQPRVMISSKEIGKNQIISFTSPKYMMGGAYLWQEVERRKFLSYEGYNLNMPIFEKKKKLNVEGIFPFDNNPKFAAGMKNGFFVIYDQNDKLEFHENEVLTERFGGGLINSNMASIGFAKVIVSDITNNGLPDVILGENDWSEYRPDGRGWSDKDYRPFDEKGNYRGGPLHGRVYVFKNLGEDEEDPDLYKFTKGIRLENVDQYGFCTPVFADFRRNGSLDMISGDFIRNITYFKNIGIDRNGIPLYDKGINIVEMPGVINYVEKYSLENNEIIDLIVSSENGHIYLIKNTGEKDKNDIPIFLKPMPFMQTNPPLKSDILPVSAVGKLRKNHLDLICGNGSGNFDYFMDIHLHPLHNGIIKEIPRILPPYPQGSIQGPSEIGWGYTCSNLFDWNQNGLLDLIFSDINGDHQVSINVGDFNKPKFSKPIKLKLEDTEMEFKTVWRVRPALIKDIEKIIHYYCLDEEGRLLHLVKSGEFVLKRVDLVKTIENNPITFTNRYGGSRGRIKLCITDWNNNGIPDLLFGTPKNHDFRQISEIIEIENYPFATIAVMINIGNEKMFKLQPPKYLYHKNLKKPPYFGHHSCSPEVYDYEGEKYVIVGTEDGQIYRFKKDEFYIKE